MQFNQNQEIFMAIDGFPNYEISNFGRVRNSSRGKIRKQSCDGDGYKMVNLYNNNQPKTLKVHKLVAEAFIPNPNNYPTVDHIDKNNQNNHYSNLRWTTLRVQARNKKDLYRNNTSGRKGVRYDPKANRWIGQIYDNNGNHITKSFSINKYPNAKELVIEWRKQKEIEFNYS